MCVSKLLLLSQNSATFDLFHFHFISLPENDRRMFTSRGARKGEKGDQESKNMSLFSRKCRKDLLLVPMIDIFSCTELNGLFHLNSLLLIFVELEELAGAFVDRSAGSSIAEASIMLMRFNASDASQ